MENSLGRLLVGSALDEDIEDMTLLVKSAPQIVTFAVAGEKDFVQVPLVPRSGAPPAELIGIGLPEGPAPIPHGFVGQ
jgi:hypothetical protein